MSSDMAVPSHEKHQQWPQIGARSSGLRSQSQFYALVTSLMSPSTQSAPTKTKQGCKNVKMHVRADIEHARSRFFSQHSPTGEQHARATTCDANHKADVEVAAQMHLRRPATRHPSHNPPNPRSVTRLQATLERATEELAQLRRSTPRPLHRSPASSVRYSCNAPPASTR